MKTASRFIPLVLCLSAIALFTPRASAQIQQLQRIRNARMFPAGGVAPAGSVNLPYTQSDGAGNNWMIYDGGWLRENNMQPIYSQAEMLTINGMGANANNNLAQLDPKTGELILDNISFGSFVVTRRILIGKTDASVRYIDIIKNTQNQAQNVTYALQSIINFGINSSENVADPKHPDNQIGWVGMTGVNRAAVEMFAGKGAKLVPAINYQQGSNMVQASLQLAIPAGKSVAVMHLLATAPAMDQGKNFILSLNESKLMHSLPTDVRRAVVNFRAANFDAGDIEILRGDAFDVVELRSGDQMQGTLQQDSYKLNTFYGDIDLPSDQVIGIINVGLFRPRQLLVTSDGQIFGGQLQTQTLPLQLSSGQVVQVPLADVSRAGYRKRPGEPDEWTFDKPCVLLRTGDRVNIQMPTSPISVDTRYGMLKLDPQAIAYILFLPDDIPVHQIFLTDGSRFAGLVDADQFQMTLANGNASQPVKFPASSISRLQLVGKVNDADDTTPSLSLANQDVLVGALDGRLKLDTSFDTLDISAPEIKHIAHTSPGSPDIQITLWDNTTVSGQLEQQTVHCQLLSGAGIDVPISLLEEYSQPLPLPSPAMIVKIKATVTDLSADDWKQRDQAEATLTAMGPSVMSVLKSLRPDAPPETQARIDAIMKQLSGAALSSPRP